MNKNNGITMIEVMIIVAILGTLLAIIIPALYGERHYRTKCIDGVMYFTQEVNGIVSSPAIDPETRLPKLCMESNKL